MGCQCLARFWAGQRIDADARLLEVSAIFGSYCRVLQSLVLTGSPISKPSAKKVSNGE